MCTIPQTQHMQKWKTLKALCKNKRSVQKKITSGRLKCSYLNLFRHLAGCCHGRQHTAGNHADLVWGHGFTRLLAFYFLFFYPAHARCIWTETTMLSNFPELVIKQLGIIWSIESAILSQRYLTLVLHISKQHKAKSIVGWKLAS